MSEPTEPIAAIAVSTPVTLPKREIILLLSILSNDRQKPSKDKARRRSYVLEALREAMGADTVEEILDHANGLGGGEGSVHDRIRAYVAGTVDILLSRATMDAIIDFANAALEQKDRETEEAIVTGLQQDRLLSLLDRIEAARGKKE